MARLGKLIVITGPMFAGKTTKLIGELRREQKRKRRVVVFKASFDNRYSDIEVVTHDGAKMPAVQLPTGQEGIEIIRKASDDYDVIAIDEAHFWNNTAGFANLLNDLAFQSKTVYVTMLKTGMWGEAFNISKELMPMADMVYSLDAICAKCGNRGAVFTQRIKPLKPDATMADMVGGSETYQSRCRSCFDQRKPG